MLKNVLKNFEMSEQYLGCLDKMSEVNFSPAETLALLYLPSTTPLYASVSKGAASTIF